MRLGRYILVPQIEQLVNKTRYTLLKKAAERPRVEDLLDTKQFAYKGFARRLLGGMVALQPKVSSLTWEASAFYFHDALLHHLGVKHTSEQVIKFSPSRQTFENMVLDFAIDTLIIVANSINKAGTYTLSFDKGDKNKNKNAGLVKLICWFAEDFADKDHPEGQIMMVPLDGDQSRGSSPKVGKAVAFSVAKLLLLMVVICVAICTDSGGGGTGISVALVLI